MKLICTEWKTHVLSPSTAGKCTPTTCNVPYDNLLPDWIYTLMIDWSKSSVDKMRAQNVQ